MNCIHNLHIFTVFSDTLYKYAWIVWKYTKLLYFAKKKKYFYTQLEYLCMNILKTLLFFYGCLTALAGSIRILTIQFLLLRIQTPWWMEARNQTTMDGTSSFQIPCRKGVRNQTALAGLRWSLTISPTMLNYQNPCVNLMNCLIIRILEPKW